MANKMTATEYLTARGWIFTGNHLKPDGDNSWVDPSWAGYPGTTASLSIREGSALTVQRARDAAEERAAWVAFGAQTGGSKNPFADNMLKQYRERFAVEIVKENSNDKETK